MNRHFKVQTTTGIEDIHCIDRDDSKEGEVWFIFNDLPPRVFQKTAIHSIQEIPVPTEEQRQAELNRWNEWADRSNPPDDYSEPGV